MYLGRLSFGAKKALKDLIVLYKQTRSRMPVDTRRLVGLAEESIRRNSFHLIDSQKKILCNDNPNHNVRININVREDELAKFEYEEGDAEGEVLQLADGSFRIWIGSGSLARNVRWVTCHELAHIFITCFHDFQKKPLSRWLPNSEIEIICEEIAFLLLCPLMTIKSAT